MFFTLHSIYSTNALSLPPSSARSSKRPHQYQPQMRPQLTAIASHARQMKIVPSAAYPLNFRKKRLCSAKQPVATMCTVSASNNGQQRRDRRMPKSHAPFVGRLGRLTTRLFLSLLRRAIPMLRVTSILRLNSGLVDDVTVRLITSFGSCNNVAEGLI